jgi:hypothetical protein
MEIGCGDGSLGLRGFPSCAESLGWDLYGDVSCYALLVLHKKPEPLPCHFSYPLEVGHLKLHTVGDVNLSHSLGIDFGCAEYESDYGNNADGWYD